MLLKGVDETLKAPSEKQAAEMVLIRLAYAADLPSPTDLIKEIKSENVSSVSIPAPAKPASAQSGWSGIVQGNAAPVFRSEPEGNAVFDSLADIVAYAYKQNEMMFAYNVERYVSLVSFEQGKIEFFPLENTPPSLAGEMVERLKEWTGRQWIVSVVSRQGGQTLLQQARANAEKLRRTMAQNPLVSAVLLAFPNSKIETIRPQKSADPDNESNTEGEIEIRAETGVVSEADEEEEND